jgi:hypothetical protein
MRSLKIKLFLIFILFSNVICFSQASKIFWIDQSYGKIQSANLDGSHVTDIKDSLQMAEGIALDTLSEPMKIYYSESGLDRIVRMNFDGSDPEEVVTGVIGLEDIALDLENRKIYWLKNTYSDDRVSRANMDGLNSEIEDLYTSSYAFHDFRGIGINPDSQLVFWTQTVYGKVDRINRLTYAGTYWENIGNYSGPRDLDVVGNKIYWSWGSREQIMRANLDGSEVDTVLINVDGFYLVVSNELGKIYSSENNKIVCADLDTTEGIDLVTGLGSQVRGIALYYNPAAVSVEEQNHIAVSHQLNQNYPNPFNPQTVISWQLAVGSHVELSVYNLLGEKIATLISESMTPGDHTYTFNGKNLASGVYYYQLVAGDYREVKKMILLR